MYAKEIRKRAPLTSKFYFDGKISLVQYIPKKYKIVTVMSTLHHDDEVLQCDKKLPAMIKYYNQTKSGVDTLDQLVSIFTTKRKINRWPVVLFFNILDISLVNAYVLMSEMNDAPFSGKYNRRRNFIIDVGMVLISEQISKRTALPRSTPAINIIKSMNEPGPSSQPPNAKKKRNSTELSSQPPIAKKRKSARRCEFCNWKDDRKSVTSCSLCCKTLCGKHRITMHLCQDCKPEDH